MKKIFNIKSKRGLTVITVTVVTASVFLLSSCGGGGGSSGITSSSLQSPGIQPISSSISSKIFPVESALTAFAVSSFAKTLTSTDTSGNILTMEYSQTPGADTSFEGKAAKTVLTAQTLKVNGVSSITASHTVFFQTSPFKILGSVTDSGEYAIASNQTALPASGKVGDFGNLFTATEYPSRTSTVAISTNTASWSIEADTQDTAFLCLKESRTEVANSSKKDATECYKMNAAGQITGMRIIYTLDGQTLTFDN